MPIPATDKSHALDHIVVVLFENRSFDNVLGHLYGPDDGKNFEGVIGKNLSNPIPAWAEHGADRKVVPYTVASDMDSPNPDSGEEYFHTNTQLFNKLDDHNRYKIGDAATAPWNAPPPGAVATMDGFVTDYISTFTGEIGRQPTYDEYAHIMTGYAPEQLPVLNGIARDFGVFDHWFCEVPSQTFMNRSFWTAATSSGLVVNSPMRKWFTANDAETIFERLEAHGRTWKVYVMEPMVLSFTGLIHFPRLKDRLATHFVPFAEFERDAAAGTLPHFSLIEPNMLAGHGDYHPAMGRSFSARSTSRSTTRRRCSPAKRSWNACSTPTVPQPQTSARTFGTRRCSSGGTNPEAPTTTSRPGQPRRPTSAPPGECDFTFDRSGYRVPAVIVSPWIEPGSVHNDEYRHTSLIATLRKVWGLGDPFTPRDASARTFDHVLSRNTPRNPNAWATPTARPVPQWTMDTEVVGKGLSTLGKGMGPALITMAKQMGVKLPAELDEPEATLTPSLIVPLLRNVASHFFAALAQDAQR